MPVPAIGVFRVRELCDTEICVRQQNSHMQSTNHHE